MTRKYTCKILDMIDDGVLAPKSLAESLLQWLSEDDVKEFYECYGFEEYLEDEEV